MKICWDNLEKFYFTKNKTFRTLKSGDVYYEKICPNCKDEFIGTRKNICCSTQCSVMYKKFYYKQNLCKNDFGEITHKRCIECKNIVEVGNFNSDITKKSGIRSICKDCQKKKDKMIRNAHVRFKTYKKHLENYEECRCSNNLLEVRCTNCGDWFKPTKTDCDGRIKSIDDRGTGENRFYCSEQCKESCSIFHQILYPKGFKNYSKNREVQPELRQMCLERDNYTCIKCGSKHKLVCHHIEGIQQNPLESADLDMVVTICENCHKEIHSQEGCKYNNMRC